ncbi:hypothetical protein [Bacillus toyonensis]|nr:hypothetical protein [Bacillus toyonensis]
MQIRLFRLFRCLWAVRLLSQNSAGEKKLVGSLTACKCPIGEG